jgi:uncharacterized damage-inducible protein DinB
MSNLQFCIARRKAEIPTFVRVLKALPPARLDYRPDPKARTAGELASLLVFEEGALVTLIDTGSVTWKEEKPSSMNAEKIAADFERHAAAVDERLRRLDDAGWQKRVRFLMEGVADPWEDTLSEFVWGFLFDEVHHRGQLTTYLRPMGGKVPSIYGPSADDPGH